MDIVAFPFHDRRKADVQGIRWRDGHLIEELARRPDVGTILIVDRPTSRTERLVRSSPRRARGELLDEWRGRGALATVTRVAPRTLALDVAVDDLLLPIRLGRGWWFEIFRRPAVLDAIGWATSTHLGQDPVAIAWTPTVGPAIRRLRPRHLVFDSLDNWLTHPLLRGESRRAEAAYAELLPMARRVVVSAPRSREVLGRWASDIEVVPNGVDPAFFAGTFPRPDDLPAGPIVGYAGTLGPRIDGELVTATARLVPSAHFVFLGQDPSRRLVDRLASPIGLARQAGSGRALESGAPNVVAMGDRRYESLPSYLAAFDVAWIPHAVGEGESGGDPIKMYEYWAAGREVVATKIDGLDRWARQLHLVTSPAEAGAVIGGLLDGSVTPRRAPVPEDRTWTAIAARLVAGIDDRS